MEVAYNSMIFFANISFILFYTYMFQLKYVTLQLNFEFKSIEDIQRLIRRLKKIVKFSGILLSFAVVSLITIQIVNLKTGFNFSILICIDAILFLFIHAFGVFLNLYFAKMIIWYTDILFQERAKLIVTMKAVVIMLIAWLILINIIKIFKCTLLILNFF